MNKKPNQKPNLTGRVRKPKLKEIHVKILLLRSDLKSGKEISKILHKSESNISEHLNKMVKLGYLTDSKDLTAKGRDAVSVFLWGYEKNQGKDIDIRSHSLTFKARIIRFGSDFESRIKEFGSWVCDPLKNWKRYRKEFEGGVKVHITPKSVLFYLPELLGYTPEGIMRKAVELANKIKLSLESDFKGLVIGTPEVIYEVQASHLALRWDWFAKLCSSKNVGFKSDRLVVDHSKGVPELEAINKDYSRDDLRSIMDFYEDLVRGSLKWKDINYEFNEQGILFKSLFELGKRIDVLKCRQDGIIRFLGKYFGDEVLKECGLK